MSLGLKGGFALSVVGLTGEVLLSISIGMLLALMVPVMGYLGLGGVLSRSMLHGSTLLLIGSLVIGYMTGERGEGMMKPFTAEIFKGLLSFFLFGYGITGSGSFGEYLWLWLGIDIIWVNRSFGACDISVWFMCGFWGEWWELCVDDDFGWKCFIHSGSCGIESCVTGGW